MDLSMKRLSGKRTVEVLGPEPGEMEKAQGRQSSRVLLMRWN